MISLVVHGICFGYCSRCERIHTLPTSSVAVSAVKILRNHVLQNEIADLPDKWWLHQDEEELFSSSSCTSPASSNTTSVLLSSTRGKMLGALETIDEESGKTIILGAYAGKLAGNWTQPGWVSPIVVPEEVPGFVESAIDVSNLTTIIEQMERQLVKEEDRNATSSAVLSQLRRARKKRATEGIVSLQTSSRVRNFRGEEVSLPEAYNVFTATEKLHAGKRKRRRKRRQRMPPLASSPEIIPSSVKSVGSDKKTLTLPGGIGDCAAPRLLNAAAKRGLRPIGIAEIFAGPSGGMSKNRQDGMLYDACSERCQPILGWMLCGLDDDKEGKQLSRSDKHEGLLD